MFNFPRVSGGDPGGGERVALRKKIVLKCNFFVLSILIEVRKAAKGLILASSR